VGRVQASGFAKINNGEKNVNPVGRERGTLPGRSTKLFPSKCNSRSCQYYKHY
jgi:hypothetical protein